MPITQRGDSWQASVSFKGKRYRKDFPNKREAELWEAETKARLIKEAQDNTAQPAFDPKVVTIQQMLDIVHATHWRGTKGVKTAMINANHCVQVLGANRAASSLCYNDVITLKQEFQKWRRSDATINRKLAAFSMIVKEAHKLGHIDKLFTIGLIKERAKRVRFYTDEELNKMLDWCQATGEDELYDYIVVSIDTGFRQGEILKITKEDVRGDNLWTYDTKAGDNRDIPLTPRVKEVLHRKAALCRQADEKLFKVKRDTLRSRWKSMQSAVGMEDDRNYVPHVLRHTFVTNMLQHTDIRTVQELAGHKRIETTQRYAHTSAERKRIAILKLSEQQSA